MSALRIAIVGAESTGRSMLAVALVQRLAELTRLHCTAVGEWLRQWCDTHGRTPLPAEQLSIAQHQQALIDAAAADHNIVVADTTALMTSVYSELLVDDRSLEAYAIAQQRRCDFTLTALDIANQPDGSQVRGPVNYRVRALLIGHRLPWALVSGSGEARLESALDAVAPLLRARGLSGSGLFSRLAARDAADTAQAAAWRWVCDSCDVRECEHALLGRRG